MLIIGFGSKARQGKDVAVRAVIDYYDQQRDLQARHYLKVTSPKCQRIGFADSLYELCRTEYQMVEKNPKLLQDIGMQKRQTDQDYWINRAFEKIEKDSDIVLIPDMRYLNEFDRIKQQNGHTVNITRKDKQGRRFISPDRPADHASEISLDQSVFDFYLINQEGHEALLAQQAITLVDYLWGLTK